MVVGVRRDSTVQVVGLVDEFVQRLVVVGRSELYVQLTFLDSFIALLVPVRFSSHL